MKLTFAEVDIKTLFLLPRLIQDWIPKGHLALFVVDIVDQLGLGSLKASYYGCGSQSYSRDENSVRERLQKILSVSPVIASDH